MKTITLELNDNVFDEINQYLKEFHKSQTELIKEALNEYILKRKKEKLKQQIQKASFKTRKIDEISDFDNTLLDGIDEKG